MKKLILSLFLIPSLSSANPLEYMQKRLELSCITGNAKRIKDESSCKIYLHQLASIPEPSCVNARTTLALFEIMDEAKRNDCRVDIEADKPHYTIEFSNGNPKESELKKETEAYTNGIDRKMYKR